MLTLDDLRNSKRQSGFAHVYSAMPGKNGNSAKTQKWRAGHGPSRSIWTGPVRTTSEEAAQDYCDYINGQTLIAPTTLNYPGHPTRTKASVPSEVDTALGILRDHKAQKQGRQGYVYFIGEKDDDTYLKIGYSVNPEARVGELQTGNARELYLIAKVPGTLEDERKLHQKYIKSNVVGEWFFNNEVEKP